MATDPARDPIDDEILALFDANPGLREELDEMDRLLELGQLETFDSADIDADLERALGRPIKFR